MAYASIIACMLVATLAASSTAMFVDITAPALHVKPGGTQYAYIPHVFVELNESVQFIGFEPIINSPVVHHMLLYRCDATLNRELHISTQKSKDYDSISGLPRGCEMTFACVPVTSCRVLTFCSDATDPTCSTLSWAPGTGAPLQNFPANVGMRASSFMALQMHYDSTAQDEVVKDTSGFRLKFSSPRKEELWMLRAGGGVRLFKPDGVMPPGRPAFFDTHACFMSSDRPMRVILASPHMHLSGWRMWADVFRYNAQSRRIDKVAELGRTQAYNFHSQEVLRLAVDVLPGDVISTTCIYNTTSRNSVTRAGPATKDEMCFMFIMIWPDAGRCIWHASDPEIVFSAASGDLPMSSPITDSRDLYALTDRRAGLVLSNASELYRFMAEGKAPFQDERGQGGAVLIDALRLSMVVLTGMVAVLLLMYPHLDLLRRELSEFKTAPSLLPQGDWHQWTLTRAGDSSLTTRAALMSIILLSLVVNVRTSMRRYTAPFWFIYATHWCLLVVATTFVLGIIVAYQARQPSAPFKPPLLVHCWLACQGVAMPTSLLISLAFWARVIIAHHMPFMRPPLSAANWLDSLQIVMNHGGNFVLLQFEHTHLNSFHLTIAQSVCFVVAIATYMGFTYIYYLCGGLDPTSQGHYIYPSLRYGDAGFAVQTTAILANLFVSTLGLALAHWLLERQRSCARKS